MSSTTLLSCFFRFIAVLLGLHYFPARLTRHIHDDVMPRASSATELDVQQIASRNIHFSLYFCLTRSQISSMKCWSTETVFVLLLSWRWEGGRGGEGMKRNGLTEEMARLSLRWGSFSLRSLSTNMFLIYHPACFALWSPFHTLFGYNKVII